MVYNIKFFKYNKFFHLYYVEGLHKNLEKYYPIKLHQDSYKKYNEEMGIRRVFNYPIHIKNNYFSKLCEFIVKKYYIVSDLWEETSCMAYYQTDKDFNSSFHNHIENSLITATAYINPTMEGEGGELELISPTNDKFRYQPQKDVVSLFPSWMLHKPLPQTREELRICLNWGYDSAKRPIHKLTGDRW